VQEPHQAPRFDPARTRSVSVHCLQLALLLALQMALRLLASLGTLGPCSWLALRPAVGFHECIWQHDRGCCQHFRFALCRHMSIPQNAAPCQTDAKARIGEIELTFSMA
jgi:hypothetical protein